MIKCCNQNLILNGPKTFDESSRYEGSWEKGSKIKFVGTNAKGEQEGMVGEILENKKQNLYPFNI